MLAAVNSMKKPNAERIKDMHYKVSKSYSKSMFRQQKVFDQKALLSNMKILQEFRPKEVDNLDAIKPQIELFARREDSGLWSQYDIITGVNEIDNILNEIDSSSGIQEEISRSALHDAVERLVFERNTTQWSIMPTIISKIKETLPGYRKTRSRNINIGYKIVGNKDVVITPLVKKPLAETTPPKRVPCLPYSIRLKNTINDNVSKSTTLHTTRDVNIFANDVLIVPDTRKDIEFCQWIDRVGQKLRESNATDYILCSDGRAVVSGKGQLCVSASGAIYVVPIVAGVPMHSTESCAGLHISEMEVVAVTPYDSELLAGLAAVLVAQLLARPGAAKDMYNGASSISPLLQTMKPKVTFLTDSKHLRKSLLTEQLENPTVALPPLIIASDASPEADSIHSISVENRMSLWRLARSCMESIERCGVDLRIE